MLDDNNINHHNDHMLVYTNHFWFDLFTFHEYFLQNFTAQPLVIEICQQLVSCKKMHIWRWDS